MRAADPRAFMADLLARLPARLAAPPPAAHSPQTSRNERAS
jgi:hypothetical protein